MLSVFEKVIAGSLCSRPWQAHLVHHVVANEAEVPLVDPDAVHAKHLHSYDVLFAGMSARSHWNVRSTHMTKKRSMIDSVHAAETLSEGWSIPDDAMQHEHQ